MYFAEISILGLLGFNVQVQHPHGFMINYLKSLELEDNHDLAQRAWNYLNDRYEEVILKRERWLIFLIAFFLSLVAAFAQM